MSRTAANSRSPGIPPDVRRRLRELEQENVRLREQAAAARQEADFLREVADRVPVPLFVKDAAGKYVACNAALEAAAGMDRAHLMGKSIRDIAPPEIAEFHAQMDRRMMEDPRPQVYEHTFRYRDGTRHPAMFLRNPLLDAQGRPTGLVGVALDLTERKQAEEALRQSEERLCLILRHSSDGINIVEFDPKTTKRRLILCNDPYVDMSGYSRKELLAADDLNRLVHAYDDPARAKQDYRKIIDGVPFTGRGSWIRPDGRENYYEWTAAPIRVGDKIYIIGIDRDVTERHIAERALDQAHRRLQSIIRNSWDVIFEADLEGNYTFGNPAAERLTGYSLREVIGMSLFRVVAPEYHDMIRERLRRRRAGEDMPQPFQFEIVHRDGRRIRVELVTNALVENGVTVGIQGIARDVTDRLRAERELHAVRERLQHLISVMPAAVYASNVSGDYEATYVSERVREVLGYEPQQFVEDARFWLDRIHPEDAPRVLAELSSIFQRDHHVHEYRFLHKDGSWRWMYDEMALVRDAEGRPLEIVGYWADITDRKAAEEALRAAHRQLIAAREEERKRLASELHDSLGQELISLHLKMQGLLPEVVEHLDRKHAAELESLVQRCRDVIRDVRTISHGLYPPLLESVGLAAAIRGMVSRLASPIPVKVDCPAGLDKRRWPMDVQIALFRIAQEALRNAVRHSRAARIKLSLRHKHGWLVLSVRDDGVGMDAEAASGGLGMSTMRDRAETVGGELIVESRPGSTRVEARVPAEATKRE